MLFLNAFEAPNNQDLKGAWRIFQIIRSLLPLTFKWYILTDLANFLELSL